MAAACLGEGEASWRDEEGRDVLAFLMLTLREISASVERTAEAWEDRGYWVKADRFRREWSWSEVFAHELSTALRRQDWEGAAGITERMREHLAAAGYPSRGVRGEPWQGAWRKMIEKGGLG